MKTEKFKVIDFIRQFIIMMDKELECFPKKEIEIKNRIKTNSFDILELAYEANSIEDKYIKKDLLLKILSKVKVIDFLLNLSFDKKLISQKVFLKLSNKLEDILKYVVGWQKLIK